MTSVPEVPGAPAVILYRQVDRDDVDNHEFNYLRIKILTEEGRKYANVEIPFFKSNEDVHNIKARTIRADGSVVNFEGKPIVYKMIVKAKGIKYMAKVIVLPGRAGGQHYRISLHEPAQRTLRFQFELDFERRTFHQACEIPLETQQLFPGTLQLAGIVSELHPRMNRDSSAWRPITSPRFKRKTTCRHKMN